MVRLRGRGPEDRAAKGRGAKARKDTDERRSMLPVRSVAGQVFVLHVVIVLVLAIAALVALVVQARHDSNREARTRSLAVAETFANTPNLDSVLRSPDPTAILQPRTEAARKAAGVDFIVVTDDRGYRYTHPFPSQIGLKINGRIRPAQHGRVVVQTVNSPLGRLVQVVVPVFDSHHQVVGLVASGITTNKISGAVYRGLPLLLGAVAAALLLATAGAALVSRRLLRQTRGLGPLEMTRMYEHHDAVLHAVREGVLIVGGDRRLLLVNDEARRLLDLPADPEGRRVTELGLDQEAARLLGSGRAATDEVLLVGERLLAVNQRPTDEHGGPPGWVTTVRDSTELRALSGRAEGARERLRLLYDASGDIGTTLDVQQTASELADVAVPRFADFVTVDLAEEVPDGDEPQTGGDAWMRRTAVSGIRGDHPLYPPGFRQVYAPSTPFASGLGSGQAVLERDLHTASSWQRQDAGHARLLLDYGIHSLITVPLRARGVLLGMVNFWRADQPEPFEEDDLALAEELAARAAVCIDNARRYTREHSTAVTLQHSLLPHGLPELTALDAAYRYLPAQAGVGGDWFDVLPLSGARVALVVGDVVGHGLHAAATMGRLRTAVHNFAALDLPPDELLGHLDELVARIDQETAGSDAEAPVAGATCLYAVYDPVSGLCTMARAGHLPPALVHPDGTVDFPDLPAGPPLGLGGLPFETAELTLPEGAALCLYTDGLVEDRDHDIDEGLEALRASLARRHGGDPETTCAGVLADLLPDRPADDVALLVARVRRLAPDRVAEWSVPAEASEVGVVRSEVTARLESWGLDELAFSTELILSELLTNSIRYASGPITVRLVLDSTLICEVADGSSTSPHLTYAAATDEGGRGLFLVAQFADRWGTRYTGTGKVIWTEQPLP